MNEMILGRDTILILYEKSGVFTELYKSLGFNVLTYDKQIDGKDARIDIHYDENLLKRVKGVLSFTPCDHLAGSGARWWEQKGDEALIEALSLADVFWRFVGLYKPEFYVLENPVGRLSRYYGKPVMTFDPYKYDKWIEGEAEQYTKRTCLWGRFRIPMKKPSESHEGSRMHELPPSPERKNLRSKTPLGFATAFVNYNR